MSKKLKENKNHPSEPLMGVSEVLRSNEELNEIIKSIKAKFKEVGFKEREASIDLYSAIGKQAFKARGIVEENKEKWGVYTEEVFNKSKDRVNESIALYRAVKRYRKKDKEKSIATWMCKSNLEKAGQMLESEDDDIVKASKDLLDNGNIVVSDVPKKAETLKPMDVLNALKELTKGEEEDTKDDNKIDPVLEEHLLKLKQADKYIVGLKEDASGINGDFDKTILRKFEKVLSNTLEHCKDLLEEIEAMEESDDE